ncbi:nuclear pore glycoprotein p62 [Neocloeon triangulifer]|uniref:nuclear pore glycoprotein p62 n=1 Tax=Neocloeon triangulifer TaxID=2078957 RepID=UPI00286F9D26|nr:nuclear pore glycoprotein p62 [Neocloeon triangulifer]
MALNLGGGAGKPGGFTFGQPAATTTAATSSTTSLSGGGFSFGNLAAPAASAAPTATGTLGSGFALNTSTPNKPPLIGGGLTFGTTQAAALNLGATPSLATTPNQGAALSQSVAPTPATGAQSFSFGGSANLTSGTSTFATPATTGIASLGVNPSPAYATPTLNLLAKPATQSPAASTAASTASTLGGTMFATKTTQDQTAIATALTSSTAASSTSTLPKLTYAKLEEEINKWSYQLEEQENIFIHQATQVNAWDRLLLESGDKIALLNSTIESLKVEQQKLNLELDYIASQERELEDSIAPIESFVANLQLSDPERTQTYEMVENLDGQTQQMANDLKKIISHLNIINKEQDENNPIAQVGRILNAHMNSLIWIHQTSTSSQNEMDEASKIISTLQKDIMDHSSLLKK